jgi:hypothetical protein
MEGIVGVGFEQHEQHARQHAVEQRLRHPPGAQAPQAVGLAQDRPAPTRWTVRTLRAWVPGVATSRLSGRWRLRRRVGLRRRHTADHG